MISISEGTHANDPPLLAVLDCLRALKCFLIEKQIISCKKSQVQNQIVLRPYTEKHHTDFS